MPAPRSVEVSSDPPSPIQPIGNSITLNCVVELSTLPQIDMEVSVRIQLYDPSGHSLSSSPPTESTSTFTSRAIVNSFGRAESGIYTCRANVSAVPPNRYVNDAVMTGTTRVTVGKSAMSYYRQ